jgi:hypothetical protein
MSHAVLRWHDRASALATLPPGMLLEDVPATRLVVDAPLQGALLKPLVWLEAQLLPDGRVVKSGDYIVTLIAHLERDGPAVWRTAMQAVGLLGAWQVMMAAAGREVWPALVNAAAPATPRLLEGGDLRAAVQQGDHLLSNNPDNQPWQVFSYAGQAERKGAKVDAVTVLAITHGDKPMRVRIAFPFRPAREGERLVAWQPQLVDGNLSVEEAGKLGLALDQGIRAVEWPDGGNWDDFYRA